MADFVAEILAKLNLSQIPSDIQKIENTQITLNNITADTKNIVSQIQAELNKYKFNVDLNINGGQNISKNIQAQGQQAGNAFTNGFVNATKRLNSSDVLDMSKLMKSSGFKNSDIANATRDIQNMNIEVSKLTTSLGKDGNVRINIKGLDEFGRVVNVTKQLDKSTGSISTIGTNIGQSFDTAAEAAKRYQKEVINASKAQKKISEGRAWMNSNPKAKAVFGAQMEGIFESLENDSSSENIALMSAKLGEVKSKAKEAGLTVSSFGKSLKDAALQAIGLNSLSDVFREVIDVGQKMYQNVVAIDTAMTELKKVTDESASSYESFLSNAGQAAPKIGMTISDYISSTADFARLGYSFNESQDLARVAGIYNVVGDDLSGIEEASNSIISTLKAFNIQANDSIGIVDKFNEVSNNFAISSGGIGSAFQKSASSLAAANNDIDQSIALITAANTVVQNPDTVGTAFKTLTMRIRGAETELQEAGLDADNMASSTAKLRAEILALSKVDIMKDENTFKSTYDILDELAKKWKDLTDIQQASITELIAGRRLPECTEMCI